VKPSGQPRLGPATIGGVSGGMLLIGAVVVFTIAIFPPLGVFVGIIVGLVLLVKWANRRELRVRDRRHRAKMDDWYRQQAANARTFVNPGWRL
jgi:flagellar biosynthesis component FlhA